MRIFIFFILVSFQCFSQTDTLTVTKQDQEFLSVDHFWGKDSFKYIYSSKNNTLYKTGNQQKFQYKNVGLGAIYNVDLLNPLELTLFYKNFNTVVKLDNNLNEIISINFTQLSNFKNIAFATTSIEQHLWIFNSDTQQLELFNYNTKKSKVIGQPIQEDVIDMKSDYNFCWLLSTKFIYKFNIYGALLQRIPFTGGKGLSINNENVLVSSESGIFYFQKNSENTFILNLSNNFGGDIFLTNDSLYIYAGDFLTHYKLQTPKKQ
ncbi:hypothetical protein SAMN05216480_105149 [Pustulibacterium marinum]|uniref:Uncharacterized protein n=1 Tax=Pustulibacterium marinum TaxID=1224947 RepID=A0A1I7GPE8_9FLAO|nr:hypothetical protein [Pustulibacterium marinum]SFU50362.1 hypothetical protein SAMN05216480_105149 [Pustulibacterium marinum]